MKQEGSRDLVRQPSFCSPPVSCASIKFSQAEDKQLKLTFFRDTLYFFLLSSIVQARVIVGFHKIDGVRVNLSVKTDNLFKIDEKTSSILTHDLCVFSGKLRMGIL